MACSACVSRVEKAARKINGVTGATVDLAKAVAKVSYDPKKTTPSALAKALMEKSGFKVVVPEKHSRD